MSVDSSILIVFEINIMKNKLLLPIFIATFSCSMCKKELYDSRKIKDDSKNTDNNNEDVYIDKKGYVSLKDITWKKNSWEYKLLLAELLHDIKIYLNQKEDDLKFLKTFKNSLDIITCMLDIKKEYLEKYLKIKKLELEACEKHRNNKSRIDNLKIIINILNAIECSKKGKEIRSNWKKLKEIGSNWKKLKLKLKECNHIITIPCPKNIEKKMLSDKKFKRENRKKIIEAHNIPKNKPVHIKYISKEKRKRYEGHSKDIDPSLKQKWKKLKNKWGENNQKPYTVISRVK